MDVKPLVGGQRWAGRHEPARQRGGPIASSGLIATHSVGVRHVGSSEP
jgi:hypothetical protein